MNTRGRLLVRLIAGSIPLLFVLFACGDTTTNSGAGTSAPSVAATPCPPAGFGDTVGGTAGHTSTGQAGTPGESGTTGGSDLADSSARTTVPDGAPNADDTTADSGTAAGGSGGTTGADGTPSADPCTRPGE